MPGVKIEDDKIVFTQSWLDNYSECNAKGQWLLENPDAEPSADYHVTGTAMHTFIEGVLMGDTIEMAREATLSWLDEQVEAKAFVHKKVMKPETMVGHLLAMMEAFERDVYRYLTPCDDILSRIERKFTMPLITAPDGMELWLEGTVDYNDPILGLMDWKTAGREWVPSEAQKEKIQPTAYTLGHMWLEYGEELWTFGDDEIAVPFTYCVHLKRPRPMPVQWVPVTRGPQDWRHFVRLALSAYESMQLDHWPVIHAGRYCQPSFCPNWDNCKGSTTLPIPQLRIVRDPDNNNQGEQE